MSIPESDPTGYAVIPKWLLYDRTLDTGVKMTYLLLSSYASGPSTIVWPSQATLAQHLGTDVRTVRRYLRTLRDEGLVAVRARATQHGRQNTYILLSDRFGGARSGRGGEDTGVLMGEDTTHPRTRTTGTRTSPSSRVSGGAG